MRENIIKAAITIGLIAVLLSMYASYYTLYLQHGVNNYLFNGLAMVIMLTIVVFIAIVAMFSVKLTKD